MILILSRCVLIHPPLLLPLPHPVPEPPSDVAHAHHHAWFIFCRTAAEHWVASFIVCVTGFALLLAFSFTACSDPGIVYRPPEINPPPVNNGQSAGAGGSAVAGTALDPRTMEEGGVLCGKQAIKQALE